MSLKRTPLRRVSVKQSARLRVYYKLRRDYLEEHPICEAKTHVCTGEACDVHHVFGRGKYLNAVSTYLAVCRSCHTWLHAHPSLARTKNLLA